MNRFNIKLVLKAARMLDHYAKLERDSNAVPKSEPPVWDDPAAAREYRQLTRTSMKLRAMTLEDIP